jgi:hypothetical protein
MFEKNKFIIFKKNTWQKTKYIDGIKKKYWQKLKHVVQLYWGWEKCLSRSA